MAEYDTKSVLLDLLKEGENKTCIDCGTPMPQWASLSFGVFVCLTCSGAHRGLGVHISFVRSLTMDKWTDAQVTKVKMGGNAKCRAFFEASPDYNKNMAIADKYTSHFASQYKDKLLAEIEGREWTPSAAPVPDSTTSSLRKPRATMSSRTASPVPRSQTSSPSYNSSSSSPPLDNQPPSQKSRNEDYFATMGSANSSRSADLPPSQGGKYGGFGSSDGNSSTGSGSYNPSDRTSSRALPSMDDLRDNPAQALSRGWGFLGAALSQASKHINESVVQPTLERAADPALQSQFSSYLTNAQQALAEASRKGGETLAHGLSSGSEAIRRDLGYDVGDLGAGYIERRTGRGAGEGYGRVGTGFRAESAEEGHGGGSDDFFGEHLGESGSGSTSNTLGGGYKDDTPPFVMPEEASGGWAKLAPNSTASRNASGRSSPALPKPKATDEWDDWKD